MGNPPLENMVVCTMTDTLASGFVYINGDVVYRTGEKILLAHDDDGPARHFRFIRAMREIIGRISYAGFRGIPIIIAIPAEYSHVILDTQEHRRPETFSIQEDILVTLDNAMIRRAKKEAGRMIPTTYTRGTIIVNGYIAKEGQPLNGHRLTIHGTSTLADSRFISEVRATARIALDAPEIRIVSAPYIASQTLADGYQQSSGLCALDAHSCGILLGRDGVMDTFIQFPVGWQVAVTNLSAGVYSPYASLGYLTAYVNNHLDEELHNVTREALDSFTKKWRKNFSQHVKDKTHHKGLLHMTLVPTHQIGEVITRDMEILIRELSGKNPDVSILADNNHHDRVTDLHMRMGDYLARKAKNISGLL